MCRLSDARFDDFDACLLACFTAVDKISDFKCMKKKGAGAADAAGGISAAEKAAEIQVKGLKASADHAATRAKELATFKSNLEVERKISGGASKVQVVDNRDASEEKDCQISGGMTTALMKAIECADLGDALSSVLGPHWNTAGAEIVDLSLADGKFRLTYGVEKIFLIKNMAGLQAFVQNLGSWDDIPTLTIIDHPK